MPMFRVVGGMENNMKRMFCATIYRMWKSTGVRIAFLITYFAAILYFVLARMVGTGKIEAQQAGSVSALGDAMIIWLCGSLAIGLLVGSDFENKTIHGVIGFGRKKIIGNYVAVFAVLVVLLVLPYTIGSLVCILAGIDMRGAEQAAISIYLGNVLGYSEDMAVGKMLLSYLSYAVVYVGQLSICIPVAVKLKKPVAVTAFGFFFGMLSALLATLASKVELLDKLYRLTPYNYNMETLGIGGSYSDMLLAMGVSIVFVGFMGLLAWGLFRRAEIK